MLSAGRSHDDYAIIWVCALPLEMAAAKAMLEEVHEPLPQDPGDDNSYTLGGMSGHNVVIACLPSGVYGTTSAAVVLCQALSTFRQLKFGLMVGIGGGVPTFTDIRLGDVVVSVPTMASGGVIQYDYGKTLSDGRCQRTSALNKPPQVLLNAVSQLRSKGRSLRAELETIVTNVQNENGGSDGQFARPQDDLLFEATYNHREGHHDCSDCDREQLVKREPRAFSNPHIHYGLIASGNQVIKDATTRDTIAEELGVLCFEMEAAGLMDQLPSLAVRGICDYCDSHKSNEWQGYAALMAAGYSRMLLTHVPPHRNKNQNPKRGLESQWTERLRAQQVDVLRKLNVARFREQKDRNPERIPGTCEWFVTHHIFQDWQASRTSRMLWVTANPGCGKSVLAKYLADSVLGGSGSRTVGYFFFKDDFEDQRSILNALCCILYQLFDQNRALLTEHIIERFEINEKITSSFSELWDILICAAKGQDAGEIICLLDALDECDLQGWSQLTEALKKFYLNDDRHALNLKFLVTSRLYGRIRRGFQPLELPGLPVIHLSGENDIEMDKICGEINIFIRSRVDIITSQLRLTKEERDVLLNRLTRVPNRTYLWVYLTLNLITSTFECDLERGVDIDTRVILEITSSIPQTVDEVYERILSRAKDRARARKLLHIIVGATRPLDLLEMNFALNLEQTQQSYDDISLGSNHRFREHILDLCGLFITIVDSRVYLLHQTAREFLIHETSPTGRFYLLRQTAKEIFGPAPLDMASTDIRRCDWKHTFSLLESHQIMAKICIKHLLFADFEEMSHETGYISNSSNSHLFLDYSAKSWTSHLLQSDIDPSSIMQSLLSICQPTTDRCKIWFQVYWASTARHYPEGITSLMVASYFGLAPVVEHLMNLRDTEINATDRIYGRTALSWAAGNGHITVVKLLTKPSWKKPLRRVAQVDLPDKDNRTPLSWAVLNGHFEVVILLLKAGAAIDWEDNIGGTPFSYAVCSEDPRVIELLIKKGAQAQSTGQIKQRLLLSAAMTGHEPVVTLLLGKDTDIETCDSQDGRTSLSWAAGNGYLDMVNLLLEHNANVESQDKLNRTPITWAIKNGHPAIARLLLGKSSLLSTERLQAEWDIVEAIGTFRIPLCPRSLAVLLGTSESHIIKQLHSLDFLRRHIDMPTDAEGLICFLHTHFHVSEAKDGLNAKKQAMHERLSLRCLSVLDKYLRFNICGMLSPATELKSIPAMTIRQSIPEELQYACCHWAYHIQQSGTKFDWDTIGVIEKQFLPWLEVMSIIGNLAQTVVILKQLPAEVATLPRRLSEFKLDATLFVRKIVRVASVFPLQVYCFTWTFALIDSEIRKGFVQGLVGSNVSLPTGRWIIDSIFFECHSDQITAIALSHDGQVLASGSIDGITNLLNADTGKCLQTFVGPSRPVTSLRFYPNDQIVVSCYANGDVKYWDTTAGDELQCQAAWSVVDMRCGTTGTYQGTYGHSWVQGTKRSPPLASLKGDWVTLMGEKAVWIPQNYRTAHRYNKIVFAYKPDWVLRIIFCTVDS